MIGTIERVRYPHLFPLILDRAIELGGINLDKMRDLLADHQQKIYAKNYLQFALQTLLLESYLHSDPNRGNFYVSPRGRYLYQLAQKDGTYALECQLGPILSYHFHAEILLVELLLKTSARAPHQTPIILDLLKRTVPWYLEHRLPWYQNLIGWKDSSNIQVNWTKFQSVLKLLQSNDRRIDQWSTRNWDEKMGFTSLSALTIADNLCQFLAGQRQRHFIVDMERLAPAGAGTLLLLMLSQQDRRSLNLSTIPEIVPTIEKLRSAGFDLRVGQDSVYLASPIKIVIRKAKLEDYFNWSIFAQNSPLFILFKALEGSSAWNDPCRSGKKYLDLEDLLRKVQNDTYNDLFIYNELSEEAHTQINPEIELWEKCRLSCYEIVNYVTPTFPPSENSHFEQDLINRCQSTSKICPYYPINISRAALENYLNEGFDKAISYLPHLYLIVLLLVDKDQSGNYILHVRGQWQYMGIPLLSFLDKLFVALEYDVWNEWYALRIERQKFIEDRFIQFLVDHEIAQTISNRLEMTQSFTDRLLGDLANLRNRSRIVRQRLRAIASDLHEY